MVKAKVYLKTGQSFDVVAKKIWCKYNTITGELTSFKYEDGLEVPIYLDVTQVVAVVQLQDVESENDAENTNLLDAIGRNAFRNRQDIIDLISNQPTVDAVPMVHGRWVHLGGDEWYCSACGFVITTEGSWDKPTKKYCEDCGAKMDGGLV